jgi:hypothetical protein
MSMDENTALEGGSVAAGAWLALLDAGESEATWQATSSLFRSLVDLQQWRDSLARLDALLGRAEERELLTSRYTTDVPGAPDGDYVVLENGARFERKQEAVETVVVMLDTDGEWRVGGYFVR